MYPSFFHNRDILHADTLLFILLLLANLSDEILPVVVITRAGHIYRGRTRLAKAFLCFALKKNED